jgi:hypothetical protein
MADEELVELIYEAARRLTSQGRLDVRFGGPMNVMMVRRP